VIDVRNKSLGRTALLSAVLVLWNVYDMSVATEAPRPAVMILQYGVLALGLFALIGSVAMLAMKKLER
jgi:hypothetical protein